MKKHIKRMAAPKSWAIPRKTSHWVTKPSPGPHRAERSMPLLSVVRDMLGLCDNSREARLIIGSRGITVDGRLMVVEYSDLPDDLAGADPEEPLAGELEVVALHVDRPGLVSHDVEAVLHPGDQRLEVRP